MIGYGLVCQSKRRKNRLNAPISDAVNAVLGIFEVITHLESMAVVMPAIFGTYFNDSLLSITH